MIIEYCLIILAVNGRTPPWWRRSSQQQLTMPRIRFLVDMTTRAWLCYINKKISNNILPTMFITIIQKSLFIPVTKKILSQSICTAHDRWNSNSIFSLQSQSQLVCFRESIEHIFIQCPFTAALWEETLCYSIIPSTNGWIH